MNRLHRMNEVPSGKLVGDLLPVFSAVKDEFHIGEPNKECACCRKPFTITRKPRKSVRLYPCAASIPFAYQYRICGACVAMYERGGADREAFSAAIDAYHHNEGADQ